MKKINKEKRKFNKRKLFNILGLILVLVLIILLSLYLIFKIDKNSYYLGKWYYKYTYLSNDKLHYTEEDGMESYIELYDNNTYKDSDYCDDIVEYGYWIETDKGIYLINEHLWLYKYKDNELRTELKDKDKYLFKDDFYNVLIRKE